MVNLLTIGIAVVWTKKYLWFQRLIPPKVFQVNRFVESVDAMRSAGTIAS